MPISLHLQRPGSKVTNRQYRPSLSDEPSEDGTIVHPQCWPSIWDYTGKRVNRHRQQVCDPQLPDPGNGEERSARTIAAATRPCMCSILPPEDPIREPAATGWLTAGMDEPLGLRMKNVSSAWHLSTGGPQGGRKVQKRCSVVRERLPVRISVSQRFHAAYNPLGNQRMCVGTMANCHGDWARERSPLVTDEIRCVRPGAGFRLKSGGGKKLKLS